MALKRFMIDGYGQLELNQVAFRRDGRIEAQCHIAEGIEYVENGMLLAIDNVNRVVKYPVAGERYPIALNYSSEHMHDERHNALRDFRLDRGSYLPRLGYLSVGDKFTSNCLCYNEEEFANEEAIAEAYKSETLYGGISEMGAILVSKTAPSEGPVLMAVRGTGAGSMPDGQFAIKFQVIAD